MSFRQFLVVVRGGLIWDTQVWFGWGFVTGHSKPITLSKGHFGRIGTHFEGVFLTNNLIFWFSEKIGLLSMFDAAFGKMNPYLSVFLDAGKWDPWQDFSTEQPTCTGTAHLCTYHVSKVTPSPLYHSNTFSHAQRCRNYVLKVVSYSVYVEYFLSRYRQWCI